MSLPESQLFRMLVGFFGRDRVVYRMSVLAVCGGEVPAALDAASLPDGPKDVGAWAKANKCLFTVVDFDDNPKVVFEFCTGFDDVVDIAELEKHRHAGPILKAAGIPIISITPGEFSEILDPDGDLDFVAFLKIKAQDAGLLAQA